MSLIFERIVTEGLAEMSYLVGDDAAGVAAVIDPRWDVDVYLRLAREKGVSITHVFETHIHADLVSGARELAARSGTACVFASVEGGAAYGFEVQPVRHGDSFAFGSLVLTARHTPGHTPEHVSYEAREGDEKTPWGVFTGDSLFVGSAGRPDLLGRDADRLAAQLYDTLFGYFAGLEDGVMIFPSHGSGSPCGAEISDRPQSTIGWEKRTNPYYRKKNREDFVRHALSTAPPEPAYYQRMKKLNAQGPPVLDGVPVIPALSRENFKKALEEGRGVLVDTRDAFAFGGGHIAGALNIGASPLLTVWAGWLLDPEEPLLLILDGDSSAEKTAALFLRSGYTKFAGYLAGGLRGWATAGYGIAGFPPAAVREVREHLDDWQIIDVRAPAEWKNGHIPGAVAMFVPEIRRRAEELDKARPLVTYCAAGYRSSLAASLFRRQGFQDVRIMAGSWPGWVAAGFPVAAPGESN